MMKAYPLYTLILVALMAPLTRAQVPHDCMFDQSKWVYRALDSSGNPIDSDSDGMPDPLVYKTYNSTQGSIDRIPNFSFAGYGRGSRLPAIDSMNLPIVTVPAPKGANRSDLDVIQSAIRTALAMPVVSGGFKAIVQFSAGTYRIFPGTSCTCNGQELTGNDESIVIDGSGIVLRGAVDAQTGANLTSLEAGPTMDSGGNNWPCKDMLVVRGSDLGGTNLMSDRRDLPTAVSIDDDPESDDYYVPLGSHSFHVIGTASVMQAYAIGDSVLIRVPMTSKLQNALSMGALGQWDYPKQDFYFLRTITDLSGDETNGWEVTIDGPFLTPCDEQFLKSNEDGPTMYAFDNTGLVRQVGIENLNFVSHFDPSDPGHPDTNECHPPRAITLSAAHDCWIKEVEGYHFYKSLVNTKRDTRGFTVMGCKHFEPVGGASTNPNQVHRRYTFNMHGQDHLVYRCYSEDGRHDWKTDGPQSSGIVFLECVSENMRADQGPHKQASVGILYDRVLMTNPQVNKLKYDEWALILGYQNFGSSTQHGWTAMCSVAWNCESRTEKDDTPGLTTGVGTQDVVKATIVIDKPKHPNYDLTAWQNWGIGCLAATKYGGLDSDGQGSNPCGCSYEGKFDSGSCTNEYADVLVDKPRSLYRAQLRDRVGQMDVAAWLPRTYLTADPFIYFPTNPDD